MKNNQIDLKMIFGKIDDLNDSDKMLLKRAWRVPFNRLRMPQKALFFNLVGADAEIYKKDFLINMMSIYVKQGCKNGDAFECVLKKLYDTGNAALKQKIGYMIDEQDNRIFINYVLRYVEICGKDNSIDVVKLSSDVLNWSYTIKTNWIKTIAGIAKNNEKTEEK